PQSRSLTFVASAYDAAGTLLFRGTTTQTLLTDRETVAITLAADNDGATVLLPRIWRISLPGDFVFGQGGNITVFVEATSNAPLTYSLTAASGGGSFLPASGGFTLAGTSGAFVVRYTPPATLASTTEFTHVLSVTNLAGHSVSTTFRTRVVPPETGGDSLGTTVRVVFNPTITRLEASRAPGTTEVTWKAGVADDGPASALSYAWSFTPLGTASPTPVFTAQTNPTVLLHYATGLQGTLSLEVTDGDNGKTTVKYVLGPNQFPDLPVQSGGGHDIAQLRAGDAHTCALLHDGTVRCWGSGASGRLGYGNTETVGDNEPAASKGPVPLPATEKVVQLALGSGHTCALLSSGSVRCWGLNNQGQLGYGHTRNIGDDEAVASVGHVNLGTRAVRITAGDSHTCALLNTGRVRCWGHGANGRLGYSGTTNVGDDEDPLVDVQVGAPVQDIVAGGSHTCALLVSGKARCWGQGGSGQLGYNNLNHIGDNEQPSSAGDIPMSGSVLQLAAGGSHTCALMETGTVRCWGLGSSGQVGAGSTTGSVLVPAEVNLGAGLRALQVSTGNNHTCAVLSSGGIKCWGLSTSGQCGLGNTGSQTTPPNNPINLGGHLASFITSGANYNCALLSNGKGLCWGVGSSYQLGHTGNSGNVGDDEVPGSFEGFSFPPP
ncbi:RTX toxin, partial [Pyxidicoccus fallax]